MPLPRPSPTNLLGDPGFELDLVLDQYADEIEATSAAIPGKLDATDAAIGAAIAGASSKATPVDGDNILLADSAAGNTAKRLTWANLKTAIAAAVLQAAYLAGVERVLYQRPIPFWLPAGDGGANGLSFTGTRGVFTLSAEAPLATSWALLGDGGYAYIPPGGGGLAGGWYWCVMIDGTNGEVFADTFTPSPTSTPPFVASPTPLANCTAGRITQVLTELTAASFIQPAGCLGDSGSTVAKLGIFSNSSAGQKAFRVRYVTSAKIYATVGVATTYNAQVVSLSRALLGTTDKSVGNRQSTGTPFWDGGPSSTIFSAHVQTFDHSADQEIAFTMQLAATTDSMILVPIHFVARYGA